ncbi:MAG TPA: hypothetical protein VIC26_02025, partial [Marinagarivorans sp.]
MFELQDSKGNRFTLSRGGSRKNSNAADAGSPLQIKRLLRHCDGIALVRAYSHFFSGTRATQKPLAANASHSNNDQTVVFSTHKLDASHIHSQAKGLPVAQRASAQRFSRERQLFEAIANNELQLVQTYVAQTFDINKAEKALSLSRSRLLSDLNAIAINERTASQKTANAQRSKTTPSHWGASSHNTQGPQPPRTQIIQQHYRRFVASLPQTIKADGASISTAPTGTTEVQSREMIKALGFSPSKVSTQQYQHALQLTSALWRDKGLYKTLNQFANAYASSHQNNHSVQRSRLQNGSATTSEITHFELALTLLLCHNQDPHSLSSPSARQIELFPRFKQAGRGLWETAEASRAIAAERLTYAGKNSAASFSDLAAEDAPVRERTTPAPVLTYIEIQLLDDQGEPVANEPYWIKDPEGNEHTGTTDASGKARVDGIRNGSCQVAFPEIEGSGIQQCSAGVDCCTPAEAEQEVVWAEFTLEDDDGNPIADEDFILTCPEGNEHSGTTGADGSAKVEGIQAGVCSIVFPNRDSEAVQASTEKSNSSSNSPSQQDSRETPSATNTGSTSAASATSSAPRSPTANSAPSAPQSSPKPTAANDDCGICTATTLETKCSHAGRAVGPSGVLQVVASPNTTSADEVSMFGMKVSVKSESGGSDKITTELVLENNKSSSCYQITTPTGQQVAEQ